MSGKIYFFGDTHGSYEIGKLGVFEYDKDDFIIVCGDFGVLWRDEPDNQELAHRLFLKDLKATVLFVDGNHENFNRLSRLNRIERFGGVVGEYIKGCCYHLLRGEAYEILGQRILVCGGAKSIDRYSRVPNVSWWAGEAIKDIEIDHAISSIERMSECDIVITHTMPKTAFDIFCYTAQGRDLQRGFSKRFDLNTDKLELIWQRLVELNKTPKWWFFGHFHCEQRFLADGGTTEFICCYDTVRILDGDKLSEIELAAKIARSSKLFFVP